MTSTSVIYPVRVYYEDTDAGGVVYHARYLHFFERARTEFLRALSFSQQELLNEQRLAFVVKNINIDYILPAKLDEYLLVETKLLDIRNASLLFEQVLMRDKKILCKATIKVACVDLGKMKPVGIPEAIKTALVS
ncbi:tol-pal system-associated acyl-CoA thioesterase [[Haemophilus] felis]|uniref:Tol-pal system-associated acyl-CoA thioesterase n=1 Tax=[Haemophilus] felis TaxID=123822 RepID=A0A1T0BBT8_9PAST|nr:tol-pal system-associated acyl-CoA thioesterase [[Haemophilus] felis]NBI39987.1 tol-pal system-associated acyl-CoA thioesterase [[Haemophilus] felis]OOS07595.1 tol-pal system-associated acyl-CoA thioesterase [[Haemophilus] felis]